MRIPRLVAAAHLVLAVQAAAQGPAGAPPRTPLGVNLEGLADWSRGLVFADAMKTARVFGAPEKPWEATVSLDERGWPKADAGSCIITGVPDIGGTYRLSFRGRARVAPRSPGVRVRNLRHDERTGVSTADVLVDRAASDLWLSWENTNGGVRDVRLLRPEPKGAASGEFHAAFLRQCRGFRVLRFMDFTATNNSPVKAWSERASPRDATYAAGRGGPWESVIALANATGRDIWINIPDQADNAYVRSLAGLLMRTLRKDLCVYVEYSNEVWNWQFLQAQRNLVAAKAEAARPGSRLTVPVSADDDPKNETYWAWKRTADRLMRVAAIFREVWGGAAGRRIRPVLCGQFANPFMFEIQLDYIRKHYGRPADTLYGIGIAPYVYLPDSMAKRPDLTKEDVVAALDAGVEALNRDAYLACDTIARWNGLELLAYEGGPDVGQAEEGLAAKAAANRDPRMRGILERYVLGWWRSDGGLFTYFALTGAYTRWGCWGLTETVAGDDPPKMQAMRGLSASPPAPAVTGTPVPGRITGATRAVGRWASVRAAKAAGARIGPVDPGERLDYLVRVAAGGPVRVTVEASAPQGAAPAASLSGAALPLTAGGTGWTGTTAVLRPGMYVLRLEAGDGRVDVSAVTLQPAPSPAARRR